MQPVLLTHFPNFPAKRLTPMMLKISQKIRHTSSTFMMEGMAPISAFTTTSTKHKSHQVRPYSTTTRHQRQAYCKGNTRVYICRTKRLHVSSYSMDITQVTILVAGNRSKRIEKRKCFTRIPSNLDRALSGLRALSVRRDLIAPKSEQPRELATKLISDTCRVRGENECSLQFEIKILCFIDLLCQS